MPFQNVLRMFLLKNLLFKRGPESLMRLRRNKCSRNGGERPPLSEALSAALLVDLRWRDPVHTNAGKPRAVPTQELLSWGSQQCNMTRRYTIDTLSCVNSVNHLHISYIWITEQNFQRHNWKMPSKTQLLTVLWPATKAMAAMTSSHFNFSHWLLRSKKFGQRLFRQNNLSCQRANRKGKRDQKRHPNASKTRLETHSIFRVDKWHQEELPVASRHGGIYASTPCLVSVKSANAALTCTYIAKNAWRSWYIFCSRQGWSRMWCMRYWIVCIARDFTLTCAILCLSSLKLQVSGCVQKLYV